MPEQLVSINPSTGKEIAAYEVYDEEKVDNALKKSIKTFEEWRKLPFGKRAVVLRNIAKQLRKEKEELAQLATSEMGKPIQ